MKKIHQILAVVLCLVWLTSLLGVAEEAAAPEAPAPQLEEVPESAAAPEPEPQQEEAPVAEPAPEVAPPAAPEAQEQAPTEVPEPEQSVTSAPEQTEVPQETPPSPAEPEAEPSCAEALAQRLGITEEELAALLGVTLDELRALDEATLEALYAAAGQIEATDAPDMDSAAPSFVIDGAGVLTSCTGEHIDAVIPAGVKAIGKNAFGGQAKLRSVTIPASVRLIDEYAFAGCEALERVSIEAPAPEKLGEEGLSEIGLRAFFGCKALKALVLPVTLKSIGDEAFRDCGALEKIEFPAETKLGAEVFAGCVRLEPSSSATPEVTEAPAVDDGAASEPKPEQPDVEDADDWPVVLVPKAITAPETLSIGVGESLTPDVQYTPSYTGDALSYSSDEPNVVKVNAKTGKLTGMKKGPANITVSSDAGARATIAVNVLSAPGKLTLSPAKSTMGVGQTLELTVKLPNNTASNIKWKSSKPSVATVENGVVTALAKGTAKITATTFNNKTATFTATVKDAPTAISVAETLALVVGQSHALPVALEPSGSAGSMTYESTNQAVVTVDEKGVLTAKSTGSATVNVRSYNGLTAACQVTVYPAPTSVTISNAVAQLGVGEKYQLNAQLDTNAELQDYCSWKSSNTKIIKVSKSGKLTAVKAGTAKITVTTGNKEATATVSIKVVSAPSKVTLSQKEAQVALTRTLQLTAKLPKGTASQIRWTSSSPNVATVDANGLVTAVSLGETVITAKTFNNKSAKCTVAVKSKVTCQISTPTITLNGAVAGTKTVDIRGALELAWACEEEGLDFSVRVSDENGGTLLSQSSKGNSSAQIAESQMVTGKTYTINVNAKYDTQYETGESSATAMFRYIDPLAEFLYTANSTGVTITEYIGSTKSLIVPAQLGGKPVTRIGTGAFNGGNCAKITSVNFPEGVVFEEDSVAGLKKCVDKNGFLIFNNILCEYFGTAATVNVPSGVVRINDGAFEGNTTVKTVKLPATLETIGERAFHKCTKLKSMSSE